MKFVFATNTYYPDQNGVQAVVTYLSTNLVQLGHEVVVITGLKDSNDIDEVYKGVIVRRVKVYNGRLYHRGNRREFVSIVLEECKNCDALICENMTSIGVDLLLPHLKKISCVKIIHQHGMPVFSDISKHDFKNWIFFIRMIYKQIRWGFYLFKNWKSILNFDAAIHIFKNDSSYQYFLKHGMKKNYVLENACDDELFVKKDNDLDIVKKYVGDKFPKKYFVIVGSFNEGKNQLGALDAYVCANTSEAGLIIIGSKKNDYYEKCLKKVKEINRPDKIIILSEIPRNEIVSFIRSAYCLVLTSIHEHFPIVLIEAMAAGVPYISVDVGSIKYLPGISCKNLEDISYWIKWMENNNKFRDEQGILLHNFAEIYFRPYKKAEQLVQIVRKISERG